MEFVNENTSGMIWLASVLAMVIVVSLMVAAYSDVATRTIPNSIVAVIAVVGLGTRLSIGASALAVSAAAALAFFTFMLVLHARGMIGGGDAKLIPAITLGLPLPAISHFVFITAMAGGLLAMIHLLGRWLLRDHRPEAPPPRGASLLRRIVCAERWRIARHGSLPYGVAIACGGIWVIISRSGS